MKSWFSSIALSALQLHEMRVVYQKAFWVSHLVLKLLVNHSNSSSFFLCCCCCWVTSVVSDSVWPHRRQPSRLCHPWDSPGKTLEWVAISFSNARKWNVKVKSLSHVGLLVTSWTAAYQGPPSMGFSRQEYWSGCHCFLLFLMQRSANFSLQGYIMDTLSFETIKSLSQLFNLPL